MAREVHLNSANVGALSNAKRAICKVPSGLGGISIIGAEACLGGAGTSSVNLIDLGTTGTVSAGTICTLGSVVFVANVPQAMTLSTAFVDEGHYIGVEELNVGAMNVVSIISFSYQTGY